MEEGRGARSRKFWKAGLGPSCPGGSGKVPKQQGQSHSRERLCLTAPGTGWMGGLETNQVRGELGVVCREAGDHGEEE